jgi:serine/threonine protein kinase
MAMQSWGPWKNVSRIGEGGAGDVFKVEHTGTGQPGALKRLKNPNRHVRFKREIEAVARLEHSSIVRLLDYSLESEPFYAVYEFEPGGNLGNIPTAELLAIPLPQRLRLSEQVCAALHKAHEASLIHRDVKPDNILISLDRKTARLCDFGLVYCEGHERQTATMEQVGSRYYIPPELEAGRADEVTPRSDIYSMGKVLYYIVSGTIFSREQHRDSKYDLATIFDDQYLEAISQILDNAIDADPTARIASAEEMGACIAAARNSIEDHLPLPPRASPPITSKLFGGMANIDHSVYLGMFDKLSPEKQIEFARGIVYQHGMNVLGPNFPPVAPSPNAKPDDKTDAKPDDKTDAKPDDNPELPPDPEA